MYGSKKHPNPCLLALAGQPVSSILPWKAGQNEKGTPDRQKVCKSFALCQQGQEFMLLFAPTYY